MLGIERMVNDDRYCIDILTQVGAVKPALVSRNFSKPKPSSGLELETPSLPWNV